jgi:hypothetical protein
VILLSKKGQSERYYKIYFILKTAHCGEHNMRNERKQSEVLNKVKLALFCTATGDSKYERLKMEVVIRTVKNLKTTQAF